MCSSAAVLPLAMIRAAAVQQAADPRSKAAQDELSDALASELAVIKGAVGQDCALTWPPVAPLSTGPLPTRHEVADFVGLHPTSNPLQQDSGYRVLKRRQ